MQSQKNEGQPKNSESLSGNTIGIAVSAPMGGHHVGQIVPHKDSVDNRKQNNE